MSDGSYQVEIYAYPVHELVDGVWVEIESAGQNNVLSDVSPGSAQTNILDNFVWKDHGVQSSTGLRLYIGSRSGYTARTYIQFATMPTIPAGSTITAATMKLTMVSGTSLAYTANAYQVTGGEWDPTTIQWTNKPAADVLLEENISNNDRTKYQFSVLTAAQHWYDGDPTGQNENYGIMLRYYDETLTGYYNSVYSGDVVDTNSRPKLTISYNPPNSSVDEGDTLALSVSGASGTVTWTSSDTSVATVNSSGVVTGVKAGGVTITASVNGSVYETFTVYVTIADGVYYIKNTNFGKYLSTTGGVAEQTWTTLKNKTTSGLSQLQQLWKIVYLGNGYYSIRPMYALSMALHATSNTVDIVTVGTTDSLTAVPLVSRWSVEAVSGGYTFMHTGTGSLKMGSYVSYSDYYITTGNYVSGATASYWTLEKVENPPSGLLVYEITSGTNLTWISRYISIGEMASLHDLGVAVSAYSGDNLAGCRMVWTKESGTSCLTINQSTGTVTGISRGTSLITGTCEYGTVEIYITVTGTASTDFTLINHYDSTILGDTELIGYIDEAVEIMNSALQRQFGVTISSLTSPYYREKNLVASCPNGNNVSCHEGGTYEPECNLSHHKNKYLVADSLYSSDIPDNHVLVFWTNHEFKTYCYDGAPFDYTVAGVKDHHPVVHFMTIPDETNGEYEDKLMCMLFVLAHEFTHTVGMEDFTDTAHTSEKSYGCVMHEYLYRDPWVMHGMFEAVSEGDGKLFCSSCEGVLAGLLSDALE